MLKLLHTADWHLGRRFPSFPEEAQKKLSRARMDVIATILDLARRNMVNAVLCAGDLFDDPTPASDFWEGLAATLRDRSTPQAPVFLVPGNHDPLTSESVWAPSHPFRAQLPPWVHVVDRDDFTYELANRPWSRLFRAVLGRFRYVVDCVVEGDEFELSVDSEIASLTSNGGVTLFLTRMKCQVCR
jgi:hypothetical protein